MNPINPHVVLWDPRGELPEGSVFDGARVNDHQGRGVVMLPVNLQLLKTSACGGYVKRSFGQGWQYDPLRASKGPALFFFAVPQQDIHWKARLQANGEQVNGALRIAPDTAQPGASVVGMHGMSAVSLADLGPPDEHGGWTIGGRVGFMAADACYLGLMLYGAATGVRVMWFAAGQPG